MEAVKVCSLGQTGTVRRGTRHVTFSTQTYAT